MTIPALRVLVAATLLGSFAALVVPAPVSIAATVCDASGADAAALANSRASIDADCPCAAAATPGAYRKCAVGTVGSLIDASELPKACKRDALLYAKKSVCGRPGATVCCRVRPDGRSPKHRVVPDVTRCVDTAVFTACTSPWQSTVTGCDASGCVAPACGNNVVEEGEACDPPDGSTCDVFCHAIDCYSVPAACGNGVVDAGEACEPPGVASCGADCQTAPCAAAAPGEIDIACVTGVTGADVAATAAGYLAAWTGPHRRSNEVLARRYDVNADPVDAALTVASDELPCGSENSAPSVASSGSDFYVVWPTYSSASGGPYDAIYGRRVDATSGEGSLDQLAFENAIGQCRTVVAGPTMAAGAAASRFAAGWDRRYQCAGDLDYETPSGALLDFAASPVRTDVALGFAPSGPPTPVSLSAGSVASLASDTLWAWHAGYWEGVSLSQNYIAAAWTDAAGTTSSPLILTNRKAFIGDSRPRIAAGAAALLVAWSQGAAADSTTLTEIRAVRATRALGNLDPDGGLLLATAATGITGGPVVAFDGARWLVVWAEASGATSDLRAVAVQADGSVVDASPRLVAANVTGQDPAAASSGDGRVLVLFARPDGASSALRGVLVTP